MRKIVILVVFLYLINTQLYSSHLIGGDISYRHIKDKKYEVKVSFYRDCRGIPMGSPTLLVRLDTFIFDHSLTKVGVYDITKKCIDSSRLPCGNNSITNKGFELHVYMDTIDLDVNPYKNLINSGICKIYFSIKYCCLNSGILTFTASELFMDAMLDVCKTNYQNSSPQYLNQNNFYNFCNIAHYQNYGGIDIFDYDSVIYLIDTPRYDYNQVQNYNSPYSVQYPVTPFCPSNPGRLNCIFTENGRVPIGQRFFKNTGNFIYTPINCEEIGFLYIKSLEYRKDSSGMSFIGYSSRVVTINTITSDNFMTPKVKYNKTNPIFKLNEKTCLEITTLDSSSSGKNNTNKTFIKIYNQPQGSTFRYIDSSAINKVGEFCWTPHDSDYFKIKTFIKEQPLIIEVEDNHCYLNAYYQQMIKIKLETPDSVGTVKISTKLDKNKNKVNDNADSLQNVKIKIRQGSNVYYTNSNGNFLHKYRINYYTFGIAEHPYIIKNTKDSNLTVLFDSTHKIGLNFNYKNGIYGRIFEDKNLNCVYDDGDVPLSNYVVHTDSNKYSGISDANGLYYINAPKGNHKIYCVIDNSKAEISCLRNQYNSLNMLEDSAFFNVNFPIIFNPQFRDLSLFVYLGDNIRRGNRGNINIVCENKGYHTMKNFKIVLPEINLYSFIHSIPNSESFGDTLVIYIDSLKPLTKFTASGSIYADPNINFKNNSLCLTSYLGNEINVSDSNLSNNNYKTCTNITRPYDPNDKQISNDSFKTIFDNVINYKIRFQNKGNDTAVRVVVVDTINTKYLELNKFQLLYSQYPCNVVFNENIIHFIFDDIYLPHLSVAGENSIGEFEFSLGMKNNFDTEQEFANSASIFFDYEDAVITEPAVATINSPLEIKSLKYPNTCLGSFNNLTYVSHIELISNNVISVELSDKNGNFNNPLTIATKPTLDLSGNIQFLIPANIPKGNYLIRLKTTNPQSVSIPSKGIIQTTVTDKASANLAHNLTNNNICAGDTFKFNFDNTLAEYKIVKNNNYSSNFSTNRFYQYKLNSADDFKVIIKEKNNEKECYDTVKITPNFKTLPSVKISIKNRKAEYCENDEIEMNFSGAKKYTLFNEQNIVSSNILSSNYNFQLKNNSIFKAIGEDSFACRNASDSMLVKVNPLANSNILVSPNPSCEKDSVFVMLNNNFKHNIFLNKAILAQDFSGNKLFINSPSNGAEISAETISDKGCKKSSNNVILFTNENPEKPIITAVGNTLTVNSNENIKWFRNGVLLAESSNTINNAMSGKYNVTVTNSLNCSENSDTFYFTNTSVSNINAINNISFYPNPAQENISFVFPDLNLYTIYFLDVNGKIVLETVMMNEKSKTLSINNLECGFYTIKITDLNNQTVHFKLLKN